MSTLHLYSLKFAGNNFSINTLYLLNLEYAGSRNKHTFQVSTYWYSILIFVTMLNLTVWNAYKGLKFHTYICA